MFNLLKHLPRAKLQALSGEIQHGIREGKLRELLGDDLVRGFLAKIEPMLKSGWNPGLLSEAIMGMAVALEARPEADELLELVLTNPEDCDPPARDTRAVLLSLFGEAQRELLIVGYALDHSEFLLKPLAERLGMAPGLKVRFCLELHKPREAKEMELRTGLAEFAREFSARIWPWRPLPEVWVDVRNWLASDHKGHALHAKCVVSDRRLAFITSANLTEAAQCRNIEAGVLIRDSAVACRLTAFFDALCGGVFRRVEWE
jgi:phosphatidylserine/phosphatidylglycerophosphate/cardiolipin synthase-like enzyme